MRYTVSLFTILATTTFAAPQLYGTPGVYGPIQIDDPPVYDPSVSVGDPPPACSVEITECLKKDIYNIPDFVKCAALGALDLDSVRIFEFYYILLDRSAESDNCGSRFLIMFVRAWTLLALASRMGFSRCRVCCPVKCNIDMRGLVDGFLIFKSLIEFCLR